MKFPESIARAIGSRPYRTEDIGRSGSSVLIFEDMVLKIEKSSPVSDNEYAVLTWLGGRLNAPRVICFEKADGFHYLLMTKLRGEMACDASLDRSYVICGLAQGLKTLWRLPLDGCPNVQTFSKRLMLARERMERGDLANAVFPAQAKAIGCEDFPSLLTYLERNRPEETLVFSHGDYCLPNVFLDGEDVGFLDLGSAGGADLWYDITICLWSIRYNFCDFFGVSEEELADYEELFFRELGIARDADKIRYHVLLDEFFQV